MKENTMGILRRTIYGILFLTGVILPTMLSILLVMFVLIPLSGIIWIITGKSYVNSLLNMPDRINIVDKYLIKLLRITKWKI